MLGRFIFHAWEVFLLCLGGFFSHRAHRVHGAFRRTVSNSQKAFGIQISQNLIAKDGCWVMSGRC